jgi:MFS family permease
MTPSATHAKRPSRLAMARTRGAVTGPILMLLGVWGALIPFLGHSFGFGFTPNDTWHWTAARGWLEVLPGGAAFLGGALLTTSANRMSAVVGGWLAAAAGAWFALGTVIGPWWSAGNIGVPSGNSHHAVWERLAMFNGLGVLIVLFAAIALGRVTVVGLRDVAAAQARDDAQTGDAPPPIDLTRTAPAAPAPPAPRTTTRGASATTGVDRLRGNQPAAPEPAIKK